MRGEYHERKNCHHSPRATLVAVGLKLRALQFLAPIREKVKIAQKKIRHEPLEQLYEDDYFFTVEGTWLDHEPHNIFEIQRVHRTGRAKGVEEELRLNRTGLAGDS